MLTGTQVYRFIERAFTAPPRQVTWCYCPGCGEDLVGQQPSPLVSDTEDGGVVYVCRCGRRSVWDFDLYPVPVVGGRFAQTA